jgi:hypothetical protein
MSVISSGNRPAYPVPVLLLPVLLLPVPVLLAPVVLVPVAPVRRDFPTRSATDISTPPHLNAFIQTL